MRSSECALENELVPHKNGRKRAAKMDASASPTGCVRAWLVCTVTGNAGDGPPPRNPDLSGGGSSFAAAFAAPFTAPPLKKKKRKQRPPMERGP